MLHLEQEAPGLLPTIAAADADTDADASANAHAADADAARRAAHVPHAPPVASATLVALAAVALAHAGAELAARSQRDRSEMAGAERAAMGSDAADAAGGAELEHERELLLPAARASALGGAPLSSAAAVPAELRLCWLLLRCVLELLQVKG